MKFLSYLFLVFLVTPALSEEKGRLDREEFDFRYTYLGISYIGANNADTRVGIAIIAKAPSAIFMAISIGTIE